MNTLANNVIAAYRNADPKLKADGMAWYSTAAIVAEQVSTIAGIPLANGAAVIAVLSPQTNWSNNVNWAIAIAEAHANGTKLPQMGLGNNQRRAAIALTDLTDVERTKGTLKVNNFYGSIIGRRGSVCIDRHAVRIAEGNPDHAGNIGSDGNYNKYADAYREAARKFKIASCKIQAVTWVDFRGVAH